MDVIPLILSEEVASVLPEEFLARLAECSTDIIKNKVMAYISNLEANPSVQSKIMTTYGQQIQSQRYLESEDTKKRAELVSNLNYTSIDVGVPEELLLQYKDAIEDILSNPYAIPYLQPIKGVLIQELRDDIRTYGKENGNKDIVDFADKLKKHSSLFRDSQHSAYRGTVVKKIVRNRSMFEIILHGINFILEKKRQGAMPSSWRYL